MVKKDKKPKAEKKGKQGLRKDPDLYNDIINYYERSKKVIEDRGIFKDAERYTLMYENKPWKAKNIHRAAHLSEVEIAIAFDVIETGLSVVTARAPMPDVQPRFSEDNKEFQAIQELRLKAQQSENGDIESEKKAEELYEKLKERASEVAKKMQRQLVRTWTDTKMQPKTRMGYREKGKTGIMFVKSVYDEEKKDIINTLVDMTTQFPSPNVPSIEEHTNEPYIYGPIISVSKAKRLYGIDSLEEGATGEYEKLTQYENTEHGFSARARAAVKRFFHGETGTGRGGYCQPLECYMPASNEMMDVEDEDYKKDENGRMVFDEDEKVKTEKVKKTVPRFPSGYKRVTIIKGHKDWILEEVDNPYKRPPFFESRNIPQAGDFFGISEIKNIEDLIMRMCNSASNLNDNLRITGNPKLVAPRDASSKVSQGEDFDDEPVTNELGGVAYTDNTQGMRWLEPPRLGFDAKWWMDFLKGWIDRISHQPDAVRGFNEFSQDSGKKIKELRIAAMGTMQTRIDEQIEICKDLYQHWVFIYQNFYPGTIIQKADDEFGNSNFEMFNPSDAKDIEFTVDVSQLSILPADPESEFETGMALAKLGLEVYGYPLISAEHLLDLAYSLEDNARAKKYIAEQQEAQDRKMQLEKAFQEFQQLAEAASEVAEQMPDSEEEDAVIDQIVEMVTQFPEIMQTQEFQALPVRLKVATVAALAGIENEPQPAEQEAISE